jgi:hypothetical protein
MPKAATIGCKSAQLNMILGCPNISWPIPKTVAVRFVLPMTIPFSDGDRTYSLAPAAERSADTNLYLEIRNGDGSRQAEALLYFYEQSGQPVP